jgi:hypothetical protein
VYGLGTLVPLAWAVPPLFHPAPDANDIFGSLRQEANAWVTVHLGSLQFIGLTGAVLSMIVRDLHGPVATLARVGIGAAVPRRIGRLGRRRHRCRRGVPPGGCAAFASTLLALSAMAVFHPPPIGPIGLLLLAGAVALLAAAQRAAVVTGTGQPDLAGRGGVGDRSRDHA